MGGGFRKDALTDLEKECNVTVGPDGHRLHDDREWVLDHIAEASLLLKWPLIKND